MDIRPILSTLRRHKTAAALIVLEVALTCAIVCNAVYLIGTRLERMDLRTGMADSELLRIQLSAIVRDGNIDAATRQDLQALRDLPGVKGATVINQVPFGTSSSNTSVNLLPDQTTPTLQVSLYQGDESAIPTLGLRLLEGRNFLPEEVQPQAVLEGETSPKIPAVILDRATADRLFPDGTALGKTIY